MKTICFFSRLALVDLYGGLSNFMNGHFNVVHLAYSSREEQILRSRYGLENVLNMKVELQKQWSNSVPSPAILKKIDELFIEQSSGRFSLNTSIRMDRTFQYLDYNDCLLLCVNYFNFWKNFIETYKIDVFFHEPVAVFMTHILANLCKKRGVFYLTQSQVYGPYDYNWIFCEGDNARPIEWTLSSTRFQNDNTLEKNAVSYLSAFQENYRTFFETLNSTNVQKRKARLYFWAWLVYKSICSIVNSLSPKLKATEKRLLDHHEWYMSEVKTPFFLRIYNNWFEIYKLKYDKYEESDIFFYYPLHAEPEAAVLYRGDGIYEGQIKLIENIAEQLPPNVFLYVKNHPHRTGFKSMVDVDKLMKIPNVKFIAPNFSGKQLIASSIGVITISGTSGFEAILLNKPVFLFGQSFYNNSEFVFSVRNIRDLRALIYDFFSKNENKQDLLPYVGSYLQNVHQGFVAYFPSHIKKVSINHEQNVKLVAEGVVSGLNRIFEHRGAERYH